MCIYATKCFALYFAFQIFTILDPEISLENKTGNWLVMLRRNNWQKIFLIKVFSFSRYK
jgi:hypothetical protein